MRIIFLLFASLLLGSRGDAQEKLKDGADLVEMFADICLIPNADAFAIAQKVDAEGVWHRTSGLPDVYANKNNDVDRQWVLTKDGKNLELIVSHTKNLKKWSNFCVLRFEAKENFYPYRDAFEQQIKRAGLSGREIDIPHLYRAGGKLKDGRPANAHLLTRSLSRLTKNYTTMLIQF